MWLLNAKTIQLEHFIDERSVNYAILSHTWEDDEVSFQDIQYERATQRHGYEKIRYTCRQALEDGLTHAWVDTCCIDKTSSAELSEAINAMYGWYYASRTCYVYLFDASMGGGANHLIGDEKLGKGQQVAYPLSHCRWFTRGWALQELLAPAEAKFYDNEWKFLGSKDSLCDEIVQITNIDRSAIQFRDSLSSFSVAERMSWAAQRSTARVEDRAYSLLGLFDVSIPLLYGEGDKAFRRLQEEIIRTTTDHTIFAWNNLHRLGSTLFAIDPGDFTGCNGLIDLNEPHRAQPYHLSNRGLEISLPVLEMQANRYGRTITYGVLECQLASDIKGPLALLLKPLPPSFSSRQTIDQPIFYINDDLNGRTKTVALQVAAKARHKAITILRRPPSTRPTRTRKVWIQTINDTGEICGIERKPPEAIWVTTDDIDGGDSRVDPTQIVMSEQDCGDLACLAYKLQWQHRTPTGSFCICFQIPQAISYNDQSSGDCRMVLFEPSEAARYNEAELQKQAAAILRAAPPSTHASLRIPSWVDVTANIEITERTGESMYHIVVHTKRAPLDFSSPKSEGSSRLLKTFGR